MLDSTPLHNLLKEKLDGRPFKRKIAFHSVDTKTGRVVIYKDDMPEDLRPYAILGSASLPGGFSPAKFDGLTNVDGGIYENLGLA